MNLLFNVPKPVTAIGFTPFANQILQSVPEQPPKDQHIENTEAALDQNAIDEIAAGLQPETESLEEINEEALKQQIEQMAEQLATEKTESVVTAFQQLMGELETNIDSRVDQIEFAALKMVYMICKRIIHKETEYSSDIILYQIRDSVKLFRRETPMTIVLNPSDYEYIDKKTEFTKWLDANYNNYSIRTELDVDIGGCRIEGEAGIADATIKGQLERLEKKLFPEKTS